MDDTGFHRPARVGAGWGFWAIKSKSLENPRYLVKKYSKEAAEKKKTTFELRMGENPLFTYRGRVDLPRSRDRHTALKHCGAELEAIFQKMPFWCG